MTAKSESITFGLVHGSWHGAWCWKFLQEELHSAGHETVAVDMPIDDPSATFEDYADVVADSLAGKENIVLVGHSRAGNIIPRVAGRVAVRKLLYLCSTFEPVTTSRPTDEEKSDMPVRNSTEYQDAIMRHSKSMTTFDSSQAAKFFYNDCSPELQDWAVKQLRPQKRSAHEPQLLGWPDAPHDYIVGTEDKVLNPTWSTYVANNWLHVQPKEIYTGHSPFLSAPRELASLVISLGRRR